MCFQSQIVADIKEYGTADRFEWINTYDAAGEAQRAWDEFQYNKERQVPGTARKANV